MFNAYAPMGATNALSAKRLFSRARRELHRACVRANDPRRTCGTADRAHVWGKRYVWVLTASMRAQIGAL